MSLLLLLLQLLQLLLLLLMMLLLLLLLMPRPSRFPDQFPEVDIVRQVQQELDKVVEEGIADLVKLLKNSETAVSRRTGLLEEDKLEARSRIVKRLKDTWTHKDANLAKTGVEEDKIQFGSELATAKRSCKSPEMLATLEAEFAEVKPGGMKQKSKKKGKLTHRLLEQGLVTPGMLEQLRREMSKDDDR